MTPVKGSCSAKSTETVKAKVTRLFMNKHKQKILEALPRNYYKVKGDKKGLEHLGARLGKAVSPALHPMAEAAQHTHSAALHAADSWTPHSIGEEG